MSTRALGGEGCTVTEIGLGCMGMSEFYSGRDEGESVATIHRALDLGVNLLDTADTYGPYTNEELVGRVIKDRRDEVVLATKFGATRTEEGGWGPINGHPDYLRWACDASLGRLGVERIDLYYYQRVAPDVPVEETVGAMGELVAAGKVAYLGICEVDAATLRRAHATYPISVVQSEFSLWSREPEVELFGTLRELGIGFVAYSPIGRGFFSGTITTTHDLAQDDMRRYLPRFQEDNLAHNIMLLERVRELAAAKGVTLAQMALAWVLAKGPDIVPIPGSKRRGHLEENMGAVGVELTADELAALDKAVPVGAAAGPRYPKW